MAKLTFTNDVPMETLKRFFRPHGDGVTLTIKVKPNAAKEKLYLGNNHEIMLAVRSPAVMGAANERVIELLSLIFCVAKTRISIVSGQHSRVKKIFIDETTL